MLHGANDRLIVLTQLADPLLVGVVPVSCQCFNPSTTRQESCLDGCSRNLVGRVSTGGEDGVCSGKGHNFRLEISQRGEVNSLSPKLLLPVLNYGCFYKPFEGKFRRGVVEEGDGVWEVVEEEDTLELQEP